MSSADYSPVGKNEVVINDVELGIELEEASRPQLKSIFDESEGPVSPATPNVSMLKTLNADAGEEVQTSGGQKAEEKLGFTWGVYLPTTQNILGVILFIRLPWIAAQAGVTLTIVIILLCVGSTLLTSLSLSAIATNGKISAGGPYFVISRNLGGELGGAIGVIFYLGTTLAASMYVLGAVESLQTGFGLKDLFFFDTQVEALILTFLMAFVVHVGVKYVNMSATFFLGVVFLSIFSSILGSFLYLGHAWQGDVPDDARVANDNTGPAFERDPDTGLTPSFFSLIGLFYPSVTGIMAGCNRSGVLKNPSKDIPVGTVGAILTTLGIYLTVVVLMGSILSNEYLKDDKLAFASIAWPPVLVNIGIVMSSVGAGMQSLTGAPRLLSAIANDGRIPFLKIFACPGDVNPTNAIWMTYIIASLPCLAGNLDHITPMVTLFFLVMYTTVNFAAFLLAFMNSPGFRPTWKYFSWHSGLLGMIWCLALMFMISYEISLGVIALAMCLYMYINSHKAKTEWGDSTAGVKFNLVKMLLKSLKFSSIVHAKNWRPQALVMMKVDKSGMPTDKDLLYFASQMKKGRGLLMCVGTIQGNPVKEFACVDPARENLKQLLRQCGIDAFCRVVLVQDVYLAFITCFQAMGIGALRPNTVITSWDYYWKDDKKSAITFVESMKAALAGRRALIIFKQTKEVQARTSLRNVSQMTGYIDIWWMIHDGGLLLLIPHLLTLHKVWRGCRLRVFTIVTGDEDKESIKELTEEFLFSIRILAEIIVVDLGISDSETDATADEAMVELQNTRLNFKPSVGGEIHGIEDVEDSLNMSDDSSSRGGSTPRKNSLENPSTVAAIGSALSSPPSAAREKVRRRSMRKSGTFLGGVDAAQMRWAMLVNKEMCRYSAESALVVTNLPLTQNSVAADFLSFTEALTKNIPTCVLIRGSGDEVVTKYG